MDNKFDYFLGVYLFVAFLVWALFIAVALESPKQDVVDTAGTAIFAGWIPALLWPLIVPLIVTVKLIHMVIF